MEPLNEKGAASSDPSQINSNQQDSYTDNVTSAPRSQVKTAIKGDAYPAIAFLQQCASKGPWQLHAFDPERKAKPVTEFFTDLSKAEAFIEKWNGKRNLYFTLNETKPGKGRKKSDITKVRCIAVDLDPPKAEGHDLEADRAEILGLLTDNLPEGVPEPTVVWDSGGGYWGLWLFETPKETNADVPGIPEEDVLNTITELERYSIGVEEAFGPPYADNCFNVDRIARLPGTLNIPDQKKRDAGRTERMASVVKATGKTYSLNDFPKGEARNTTDTAGSSASKHPIDVDTSNPRRMDADELKKCFPLVSDNLIDLIQTGTGPDEPDKYNGDRSRAQMHASCELVRAGVPDDIHYGIITDKRFGISASILDKRGRIEKYALRQIQRAYEKASKEFVLPAGDPMGIAMTLHSRKWPNQVRQGKNFMDYNGVCYEVLEDDTVRSNVWKTMHAAKRLKKGEKDEYIPVPFCPKMEDVSGALDALKAYAHLETNMFTPPCWRDGREGPDPTSIIACRNGLLSLETGELMPHTPDFFTLNALTFSYDANAPVPIQWLRFLESIWPNKPEIHALLQEAIGYLLSPDTSLQKMFLMVGPPRSGKGTIGATIEALVGKNNCTFPTLDQLSTDFGLQSMIGKQVAIISDAEPDPLQKGKAAEHLKSISGEDSKNINRKYKDALDMKLNVRFVIMANEVPALKDSSSALANRYIPFKMTKSFLGNEDPNLKEKLRAELPGILNWAIEGWRRLRDRGRFDLPDESKAMIREIIFAGEPLQQFLEEECELGPDFYVDKDELFLAYQAWAESNDQKRKLTKNAFFRKLNVSTGYALNLEFKPVVDGKQQKRHAGGVKLKPNPYNYDPF